MSKIMENKYLITIALKNGDEVNAKAVAENTTEAIIKILNTQQVADFIKNGKGIASIMVKENYIKEIEPKYKLEKSKVSPDKWVLTDLTNIFVIRWVQGKYNETQQITSLNDTDNLSPIERATILRQAGEWLYNNHKELL